MLRIRQAAPSPTPSPTPATPTPAPTDTPTPAPADAWLEPDPEGITFDGQWRQFTLRGSGLQRVDLGVNVIYPDRPGSTGAVNLQSGNSLPSAIDACQTTYYSGYAVSVGYTFHLVGLPVRER